MGAALAEVPARRLGRYELIQLLAKGGMGEVHLARTRGVGGFERLVVIKCALPALADRSQTMLLAEAKLAASLAHSNIVQVQDVGTDGDTVFLAMEYLHGQDTRAMLKRGGAVPLDQAIAIAIAVCAGLHYAHEKRDNDGSPLEIVHRDVSPSNVFVTYDGGVRLIDFGIAKATTLPSETQLGTLKGKPGYMSPEQLRCEPIDRRSDVFCVGIMLYELTTGRRAFHADNEYQLQQRILEGEPPRPMEIDAAYPPELEAIVVRALAKDRRHRQATALALQDELAAFAASRRLDLSQHALGKWMAALFADELAAWHHAQRAGQSLVEHVIKRTTSSVAVVVEPAVTAAPPTVDIITPPRTSERKRKRWVVGLTAAVAVGAIAGAVASMSRSGDGAHATPAAATSPPTSPAPAPPPVAAPPPAPVAAPAPAPVAAPPPSSAIAPDVGSRKAQAATAPDPGRRKPEAGSRKPEVGKPPAPKLQPPKPTLSKPPPPPASDPDQPI